MTGTTVERLSHDCGTNDALQVFEEEGKYNGYCYACDTYIHDPYGDQPEGYRPKKRKKTDAEVSQTLRDISAYPRTSLPDRNLQDWALDRFGIRIGLSETDGTTPIEHHYPYHRDGQLVAYKTRLIEGKKMWSVGDMKGVDLFGWDQAITAGGRKLFITEGELDAVALYQVLIEKNRGGKWEHLVPSVVSLPNGATSAKKALTENMAKIRRSFTDVVLVFDQDEAGEAATAAAMLVLPTASTVRLPSKDPNACVMEGKSMALANAATFRASAPKNTRLVNGQDLYEIGRTPAKPGIPWPWKELTRLTRGIRFGETYYIGAGVKMGKSELVNALAAYLIEEHDIDVFLAKPEEANPLTWKLLLGKVVGKRFHDPEVEFDYDAYDRAAKVIGTKSHLLNLYQHLGWESLRADIMLAHQQGCRAVFIDPITNLVNGISAGETNTILQEIAQELAAMAKDLDIVIFIFCHLKAPTGGEPHERGGKVFSHQFAGSRAMMRSCHLMLGLEGNKDPDLEIEERNMRRLVVLEDRAFGSTGVVKLYWDENTALFNEDPT